MYSYNAGRGKYERPKAATSTLVCIIWNIELIYTSTVLKQLLSSTATEYSDSITAALSSTASTTGGGEFELLNKLMHPY